MICIYCKPHEHPTIIIHVEVKQLKSNTYIVMFWSWFKHPVENGRIINFKKQWNDKKEMSSVFQINWQLHLRKRFTQMRYLNYAFYNIFKMCFISILILFVSISYINKTLNFYWKKKASSSTRKKWLVAAIYLFQLPSKSKP